MDDITKTVSDWLKEKINSPMYIVFLVAEIGWNWKYLFALFIEENIPQNQSSYMYAQQFLVKYDFDFSGWVSFFERPVELIAYTTHSFFLPILITYIFIYHLPKLNKIVHKKSLKFYFDRKEEFDRQNTAYEEAKTKELRAVKATVVEQREVAESIVKEKRAQKEAEKLLPQEELWESEFQKLKKENKSEYQNLSFVKNILISDYVNESEKRRLVYAQLIGLVSIDGATAYLAEKGKYFVKRFIDEGENSEVDDF